MKKKGTFCDLPNVPYNGKCKRLTTLSKSDW